MRFFVWFLFLFPGIQLSGQEILNDHYCSKYRSAKNTITPFQPHQTMLFDYDLTYYRFEWYIDPNVYFIRGKVSPHFRVLEDHVTSIQFDFSNKLVVDSIIWKGRKLSFDHTADYALVVNFPEVLPVNQVENLSIYYQGAPDPGGFGSFIKGEHASKPIIWTLSEPFGTQDWWPCKNGLDDKIDSIDILITTPDTFRAASNGMLVSQTDNGDQTITYHWKHRHPITPYLVALAVTNYEVYEDVITFVDGETMPMLNYVYPESITNAKAGTQAHAPVVTFFDSLFVKYPFRNEKYGHAQFGWGGGMEHQTMSFVGSFSWGLLAHELAHQWFGDYVTCGTWTDIWLNEGFATYLEGLSRERFPQTINDWQNWKRNKINAITANPGGSVRVDDPTNINRIFSSRLSYNKGAYILHMLRWKLGDALFFDAIRQYLESRKNNFATTDMLIQALEAASGENLSSFFQQWYHGEGYPIYKITWATKDRVTNVRIEQETSHPSVSFFDIPIPLTLYGATEEMNVRLEPSGNVFLAEIPTDFDVENLRFDPMYWLLAISEVLYDEDLLTAVLPETKTEMGFFPNPVQETVYFTGFQHEKVEYDVYTPGGKLLMRGNCPENVSSVDVRSLKSGMYIITFGNAKRRYTKKMVKL